MANYLEDGIRNIVFDLGQVLLKYDWEGYLLSLGYKDEMFEILANAIFRDPDWETGDAGVVTPEEWEHLFIDNAPLYEKDIKRVFAGIKYTITKFPYVDAWIRLLKAKGYQLYFLSNYSEKLYKDTVHQMDFLSEFQGGIFSYEVKCIKPDPRIYKLLLEKYNLKPEETIFYDDRKVNVDTALSLGIVAKLFTPETAYDMLTEC